MQEEVAVAQHWGRPSILDNILQALAREGIDPTRPTYFDILPYDQLRARGRTLSPRRPGIAGGCRRQQGLARTL